MALSLLFERSWQPWEVAEDWKQANVHPGFKKSKKVDLEIYRAVTKRGDGCGRGGRQPPGLCEE